MLDHDVELLIINDKPFAPRLLALLASLDLHFKAVKASSNRIGEMMAVGVSAASKETCVWMHDDVEVDLDLLFKLGSKMAAVPIVKGSHNRDQASGGTWTTRPVDRCMMVFDTETVKKQAGRLCGFEIDGYQVAAQRILAEAGVFPEILPLIASHEGSATLCNVSDRDYQDAFKRDMEALARVCGVHMEHGQRPAISRILPFPRKDVHILSGEVDPLDEINQVDAKSFVWKREVYGRVTMGDSYSIPPLMDTYVMALPDGTGIGDAIMHGSAVDHFKRLYPHIKTICYIVKGGPSVVCQRMPCFDQVVELYQTQEIPSNARTWNIANGVEGTADHGFFELGIDNIPIQERMLPVIKPGGEDTSDDLGDFAVGIQLNGGWIHKRYSRADELADLLHREGFQPVFFCTDDGIRSDPRFPRYGDGPLDRFMHQIKRLRCWVGFDSGASYIANAVGTPSVWLYATHNPSGLIGSCGARTPYRTIWKDQPPLCAARYRMSCRPFEGCAVDRPDRCFHRNGGPGANCLDEIEPTEILKHVTELTGHATIA